MILHTAISNSAEPTLRLDAEDQEKFRDVDLMLFDKMIAFDHYRQKIILICNMIGYREFADDAGRR